MGQVRKIVEPPVCDSYLHRYAEPDYEYMLEVSNIFAQSTNEEFHNIAQRIAQYVIEFVDNDYYKQAAYMVLELLVNKQSIILAQKPRNNKSAY